MCRLASRNWSVAKGRVEQSYREAQRQETKCGTEVLGDSDFNLPLRVSCTLILEFRKIFVFIIYSLYFN